MYLCIASNKNYNLLMDVRYVTFKQNKKTAPTTG